MGLQSFEPSKGKKGQYSSLGQLGDLSRLPVSIRIVLESLARNCDGKRVREVDVKALANWKPQAKRTEEVPFVVARVLLQDFTGVPLLVDLAAMRSAMARLHKDPKKIEPLVPVDMVVDHSVQVDYFARKDALHLNLDMEFQRNRARYQFLKWGMQAFDTFSIVPPGVGICHQVNLEFLAKGVIERGGVYYPDTLVGTDSHTTMVNGLGIVGWGVGGIEAEAGMLGQPVYFLQPDVVGVNLKGKPPEGTTATDLVLAITELLRQTKVVGKFVEFHGEGAAALPAATRCTVANMAPEYGATIGFFPMDEETLRYFTATGRAADQVNAIRSYLSAQGLFGIPKAGQCDYTQVVDFDLSSVKPSVAGPKRPQDRIELDRVKSKWTELLNAPLPNGYGKPSDGKKYRVHLGPEGGTIASGGGTQDSATTRPPETNSRSAGEMINNRPTPDQISSEHLNGPIGDAEIGHGSVLIAAITSCTNTSNPSVMLGAGLLAKKAVERGLTVPNYVKTSLAPGSRVVSDYLEKTGLQPYLDQIGFNVVGFGCTTCIGNSGPLDPHIDEALSKNDLVAASVLSGNRNFEARVHQSIKANFLMSPPLVVAFALAGRIDIDFSSEPIGKGKDGRDVFLRDLWPTLTEIEKVLAAATDPETYRKLYSNLSDATPMWSGIPSPTGVAYTWDAESTYIREAPYFETFQEAVPSGGPAEIKGARALAIFGDSITTDHISPAGSIKPTSPAGQYLQSKGVKPADFNSYGARRGNHEVMVRGTFANVRIKNLMASGTEGGVTLHQPSGEKLSIYDAAMKYQQANVPLVIFAGQEYGTGSSRDWAAKGTKLLGVRAVIARSFERIHRSNLVGMGVLPCQFKEGMSAEHLKLDGTETFELTGYAGGIKPQMDLSLIIRRRDAAETVPVTLRIDTPIEVDYYQHGGILPYVLRQLMK